MLAELKVLEKFCKGFPCFLKMNTGEEAFLKRQSQSPATLCSAALASGKLIDWCLVGMGRRAVWLLQLGWQ